MSRSRQLLHEFLSYVKHRNLRSDGMSGMACRRHQRGPMTILWFNTSFSAWFGSGSGGGGSSVALCQPPPDRLLWLEIKVRSNVPNKAPKCAQKERLFSNTNQRCRSLSGRLVMSQTDERWCAGAGYYNGGVGVGVGMLYRCTTFNWSDVCKSVR